MTAPSHRTANTYFEPLTDTGFKILFGRESSNDILTGFLNAVLDGDGLDPIVSITYLDREKTRECDDERSIHYDIHCETGCGRRFIVEMQNRQQVHFKKRTLFYASRAITEQGNQGDWDYNFMPVYVIAFTQFALEDGNPDVRVDAQLQDMKTGKQFSDALRLIYIQLPNFDKDVDECKSDFDCWVYLMKHLKDMNTIPFVQNIFRRVDQVARVENLSPEDRRNYERDLKFVRDYRNSIQYAEIKAREEERIEMIRSMFANGLELDLIANIAKTTVSEVKSIIASNGNE
jgi:predicted transposase/invertase (TIGR01784 family)